MDQQAHASITPAAHIARRIIPIASRGTAVAAASGGSCGARPGKPGLPDSVWERVKEHPCYSADAHHYFARMHVAVAPACNIQCNYCNRKYDCSNESRPGVVSEKLTPEFAARKVLAVAAKIPQLAVVGIAGPGDALANAEKTFRTLELIRASAPDMKLCLSTNGLALLEHVARIKELNVDHVTVTINMIDPDIGARIYRWIAFEHKRWTGREAARILSERQLAGLEALVAAGVLVKVNSVLIPGVNDEHLAEVNAAVKARGAFLHNIMPLISDPAHGTHFGLTGQRGPTAQELKALQDRCEGDMQIMRHCRQCRADAVGMLGEDRGSEFTSDKIETTFGKTVETTVETTLEKAVEPAEPAYDMQARSAYRAWVERERADEHSARERELARIAAAGRAGETLLLAVATKGGGRINQHFGHASEFQIYEVSVLGAKLVGSRKIANYCQGGYEDEEAMPSILGALEGCSAVLVAKIGRCPREELEHAGIEAVQEYAHEYIEASALAWYWRRLQRITGSHASAA
jgi:nitrogen fixation protein NifB